MDGLSAAASVLAVLQISESVISACYQYYKTAKGARKDILEVISMVKDLKGTLDTIQFLLDEEGDDAEDPRLPLLKSIDRSFKACESVLKDVSEQLGVEISTDLDPETVKVGFKKKATWPWKEKDVGKILQSLEKFKTSFILALSGETLQVVRAIQDGVKDVSESIQTMIISDRHKSILDWLKPTDPSVNHNAARQKHEPTTGDWLLKSELFTKWMRARNGSLWLYGKPGAGKTILCSTIIEHVMSLCPNDAADRYAYFYFDFSDAQKQTVTGMLRSMIAQLSVPELSADVDARYRKCNHGQQQPGSDDLVKTLVSLFKDSHRSYLIVDALDECSERKALLRTIRRIVQTHSGHVNVLVTSREERDIWEGMEGVILDSVSLECGGLDADIERHIHKCLESDTDWRNDPAHVKEEIQDALVKGAHGM
jgi:hypothetical protein